jgi:SOS-response transcriptional repressor LexA
MPRLPIKEITDSEKRTLLAYKDYVEKMRFAPSIRDLMELTGSGSSSTVRQRLIRLQEKGYLERVPFISRGIVLTPMGMSASF